MLEPMDYVTDGMSFMVFIGLRLSTWRAVLRAFLVCSTAWMILRIMSLRVCWINRLGMYHHMSHFERK